MFIITKNKFEGLYKTVILEYVKDLENIQEELNMNCLRYSRKRASRIYVIMERNDCISDDIL